MCVDVSLCRYFHTGAGIYRPRFSERVGAQCVRWSYSFQCVGVRLSGVNGRFMCNLLSQSPLSLSVTVSV